MDSAHSLVELTNKFAAYFSKKDLEGISTLLKNEIVSENPINKRVEGKEKVIDILRNGFKNAEKVSYEIINLYQDKNTTLVEFKFTADNLVLKGVDIIEWESSQIKEIRGYFDQPK